MAPHEETIEATIKRRIRELTRRIDELEAKVNSVRRKLGDL